MQNVFIRRLPSGLVPWIVSICATALALGLHALLALPWGHLDVASCQWDCAWYKHIAQHGYAALPQLYDPPRAAQADWAFFPLYPVTTGILSRLSGIDAQMVGLAVNIALLPVLSMLCLSHLRSQGVKIDAWFWSGFFVLYPLNVWYFAQYSETFYGVALMTVIVSLRKNMIWLSALSAFLLGLSRPTGFILAIFIAAYDVFSSQSREPSREHRRLIDRGLDGTLLVAAAGAGLSAYVLFLNHLTGDGFAFAHVQIAWHRRFRFFWMHIIHAFGDRTQVAYGLFALASIGVIWYLTRTQRILSAILVAVTAMAACSTGAASIERYVFSNPLVIEAAGALALSTFPDKKWLLLAAMIPLQIGAIILWYAGSQVFM